MDILSQLFGWQFMLFCLGIASITFILRSVVEHFFVVAKSMKLWKDLILPIFPVVLGAIVAFSAGSYPYPEGFESDSGRVMFGLVAGLLSGLFYRVIKSLLTAKITIAQDSQVGDETSQDLGIVGNTNDNQ